MSGVETACANLGRYAGIMRSLGADLPPDSSLGRHLMSTGPVIKAVGGQLPRFAKRPVPPKSLVSRGLVAKRPSRPPAVFRLPATGRIIIVAAMRRCGAPASMRY